jgi:predicted DNA-binding transcriptional regulator YafY
MNVKHPNRLYKSDRLNHIVSRMRLNQDITPTMLADELKVSERTIYRDLRFLETGNALRKHYSRREGRYMLETELHLPPLALTPSEALALFTAASNPALSKDNFYAFDLRSALAKIAAAFSSTVERQAIPDQEGELAPLTMKTDSIQRPTLELIRRAMRSNRKVRIQYWATSPESERALTVAPYDLRHLSDGWYLLANSEAHGAVRPFKISRVRSVEILPDRFRYPRRFCADALFARAWERFGNNDTDVLVKLRFEPQAAAVVADNHSHQFVSAETESDGSMVFIAQVNSVKDLRWWILSYGESVEVLAPEELRTDLGQMAQALATRYCVPARD